MAKEPTITLTLRLAQATHALLEAAAEMECRSKANMVEWLIVQHGIAKGIGISKRPTGKKKP